MDRLRHELPAHLLPAQLRCETTLPTTPDGKTSRIPPPPATTPATPETPEPAQDMTETEAALAGIWRELLGVAHIGLDDDYYALGGDSVQAVRIATKAAEKGLQVTRRHLFTHPTIRSLARVTTSATRAATVGESFARRRAIPLTPIQRWFFERQLPDPGHWNQSTALRVPRALPSEALLAAVQAVADHHAVLRHRFRRRAADWEQVSDPTAQTVAIEETTAHGDDALAAATDRARRGVDLTAGPLLRATLIHDGTDRRLLVLTAHHLVMDILSWGVLLDDLRTACAHRTTEDPVPLPPVPVTYHQWARSLREHADDLAQRTPSPHPTTPPQPSPARRPRRTRAPPASTSAPSARHPPTPSSPDCGGGAPTPPTRYWRPRPARQPPPSAAPRSASRWNCTAATRRWPTARTCRGPWAGSPPWHPYWSTPHRTPPRTRGSGPHRRPGRAPASPTACCATAPRTPPPAPGTRKRTTPG